MELMVRNFYLKLLVGILIMSSCAHKGPLVNTVQDKIDGDLVLNKIYSAAAKNNYSVINAMVSDSLKALAGPTGIGEMVKFIHTKAGDYKTFVIDDYYIFRIDNKVSYNYKLKVTYNKGTVDEIIGFRKQGELAVKINSYHANSDLLIK